MNAAVPLTQRQLPGFLLHVAVVRPVFVWGAPGIGKSALVARFAESLGLPCVSLLGSQLAPEDILGVPQIVDGCSVFRPPRQIARPEPYVLFLDELNACSHEVQKAFYSLIHERRVGEYELPAGSVVIGAGNRAQDAAIVKPMSSALLNRMVHVHLQVSHRDWLAWAREAGIHPWVLDYVGLRPDHLFHPPPKHEEPFSTPRSWHMLSDALHSYPDIGEHELDALVYGCLSPQHATQFKGFLKQVRNRFLLEHILDGRERWPEEPGDRDLLYFLAQSLRARLCKELPEERARLTDATHQLAHRAKALLKDLARINLEIAQLVVAEDDEAGSLPAWLRVDIVRDLPRLVQRDG